MEQQNKKETKINTTTKTMETSEKIKIFAKHSRGVLDEKAVIEIMEENEGEGYWQEPSEVISHGLADFIIKAESCDIPESCRKRGLFYTIRKMFGCKELRL